MIKKRIKETNIHLTKPKEDYYNKKTKLIFINKVLNPLLDNLLVAKITLINLNQ